VFYVPSIFRDDPAGGPDHSISGVRGDPRAASAEKGRTVLATMVGELVAGLRALGS
jgi:creatinine amidohydrolase/Fe(II)-dependent formamide hydrolase-like protein